MLNLFCCGHIRKIQVWHENTSDSIFIRADCLPEMKKDRVSRLSYSWRNHPSRSQRLSVAVHQVEALVRVVSCKRIAALCYALQECEKWQGFLNSKRVQISCRHGVSRDHENWIQCRLKTSTHETRKSRHQGSGQLSLHM